MLLPIVRQFTESALAAAGTTNSEEIKRSVFMRGGNENRSQALRL
ncbi:hypothetical protein SynA1524_02645 [Synechococcus sp. A15-24]|nr:hypothetical protein SynA1524_02645 [Synechococcus sp. A15-24]